ncbi:hypothetical protein Vi05172_g9570 [Venturia inaequalis]|nr:hypothetical protein Vi05172_g9570 [Venturia inaequalis]
MNHNLFNNYCGLLDGFSQFAYNRQPIKSSNLFRRGDVKEAKAWRCIELSQWTQDNTRDETYLRMVGLSHHIQAYRCQGLVCSCPHNTDNATLRSRSTVKLMWCWAAMPAAQTDQRAELGPPSNSYRLDVSYVVALLGLGPLRCGCGRDKGFADLGGADRASKERPNTRFRLGLVWFCRLRGGDRRARTNELVTQQPSTVTRLSFLLAWNWEPSTQTKTRTWTRTRTRRSASSPLSSWSWLFVPQTTTFLCSVESSSWRTC